MAKIRLDIDALRVETFDTIVGEQAQGTVHGRSGDLDGCDAAFIPTTDWKTCQGGDCTPRMICHNSRLGQCYAEDDVVRAGGAVSYHFR